MKMTEDTFLYTIFVFPFQNWNLHVIPYFNAYALSSTKLQTFDDLFTTAS